MYTDAGEVTIGPTPLPVLERKGIHTAGTRLLIVLDKTQVIKAQTYEIKFGVKNPRKVPVDNTW